jgi:hypothetical protein
MTGLHPRILLLALTAAALVVPTGARAQSDLQTILDDWAKALGGRERLAAPAVIEQHVTGKMFGLDGDARTWSTVDGRMRLEFDLGGGLYHFVQVLDGHQGWQVDQNGKLSPLEAHDLEAAISSAYADRNVQLLDPSRGTIELLEPAKEGPRVRCVPEGGEPITYTLDPTTHLPLRYETPAEERVQVTTILGWAERHGVQFPSAWDQSRGDPQYDAHLELQDVVFHDAVDPAWFAKPTEGAGDVFFTDGSTVKDIPIELNTVHVFVQCSVNGSPPLWFVLDTGASITVINRDTAEALGMDLQGNLEGRGAGEKTTDVHLVGDVTYGVPGVELRGQTIAAVDLGPVEAMMGRELDGILGFDFISRFVVEIDYAGLRMDLHDRNGWTYTGSGTSVPVTFEGNLPHVQAEMVMKGRDPVSGPFLVDTGANAAVYASKPFSEQHDLVSALDASFEFEGDRGAHSRATHRRPQLPTARGRILVGREGRARRPQRGRAHRWPRAAAMPDLLRLRAQADDPRARPGHGEAVHDGLAGARQHHRRPGRLPSLHGGRHRRWLAGREGGSAGRR